MATALAYDCGSYYFPLLGLQEVGPHQAKATNDASTNNSDFLCETARGNKQFGIFCAKLLGEISLNSKQECFCVKTAFSQFANMLIKMRFLTLFFIRLNTIVASEQLKIDER